MSLPLEWLADVLRGAGLTVVEAPGWRRRSASSGPEPEPIGVLEHHTSLVAAPENPAPSLGMCLDGREDLAGPLCHALIGYDGVVHVIAAGRANHAGQAKASGPNPAGDGNQLYVGFEWDYQGVDQEPSFEQYSAALRATAAVLNHLGRPPEAARGHRETTVTDKIDPGHVDLDRFRAELATARGGAPEPNGAAQERGAPEGSASAESPAAQGDSPPPGGTEAPGAPNRLPPEQYATLRRLENELLGPLGPRGEIQGWATELGPRTAVAMLVELVNGLLAQRERNADIEGIKAAFTALAPERAAPLLAELVSIQQARQPSPEQPAAQ